MCVCDCLFVSVQTEMEKAASLEAKRSLAEMLALENMLKVYQVYTYTGNLAGGGRDDGSGDG